MTQEVSEAADTSNSVITLHTSVPRREISVYEAPRVYKSMEEVQRAVRRGTYYISRTMCVKNGVLYFLCEE